MNRIVKGKSLHGLLKHCPSFYSVKAAASEVEPVKYIESYDMKEPDFNFEAPKPSEVLFSNLEALQNRLKLFQLFQLPTQLKLDEKDLRLLRKPVDGLRFPEECLIVFTSDTTVKTGLKNFVEPSDNRVSMTFYPKSLKYSFDESKSSFLTLNDAELHKLKLLCGRKYNSRTDTVTISCDRFPFQELNKQFLLDSLKKLLIEAKRNPSAYQDVPLKPPLTTLQSP